MRLFVKWVRSHPKLYLSARAVRTAMTKWWGGLTLVASTAYIGKGCQLSRDLVAGPFSYIGPKCQIGPKVEIGPYSMLGPEVIVTGGDHLWDKPGVPMIFSGRPILEKTTIGPDVWIGARAIIRSGVRIGRGAIVGAGAVITNDVPEYEIHCGVPGRRVKDRFSDVCERDVHDSMLHRPPKSGVFCSDKAAGLDFKTKHTRTTGHE
jgi:acetyltransferase-like isoleucine patch superfamily enzyme